MTSFYLLPLAGLLPLLLLIGCHKPGAAVVTSKSDETEKHCAHILLTCDKGKFYIAHSVPRAVFNSLEVGDEVTIEVLGGTTTATITGRNVSQPE